MKKHIPLLIIFFLPQLVLTQSTPDTSCLGEPGQIDWFYYGNIEGWSLEALEAAPHYPQSPDMTKAVNAIQAPPNYYQFFAATLQGFLRAPETGYYDFNLTGDDYSLLALSLSGAGDTLAPIASLEGWTEEEEHDKYPSQTADSIFLQQDQYYYFQVWYKEHRGGDHASVFWRRPSAPDTANWELIHTDYLYRNACLQTCPPAGTPCDDGNPNTYNDQQDGHCNCQGIPDTLPACVGQRGKIFALYYDTLNDPTIEALFTAPFFPLQSARSETLTQLEGPLDNANHYGTRIRSWLRVPQSGFYQFNVTGQQQVRLYLDYQDQLDYQLTEIARLDEPSEEHAYDLSPTQTSDSIWLVADSLYYLEVLHADTWGSDAFSVHWKTPFQSDDRWRVVDGFYLYAYTCENACAPAGSACDDGNPLTFDDQYQEDCSCAGTPCVDADCSNNIPYEPYAPCGNQGTHSNHPDDSWSTCSPSPSPNPARGVSHWIEYDLGQAYLLNNTHIWNYNVYQATDQGFQTVAVDYSLDGTTWQEVGTFEWAAATGEPDYTGFDWDALAGIGARYLLFTALDNHGGGPCHGLSQIRFDIQECQPAGTPCNDHDPNTTNDVFGPHCQCRGTPRLSNDCTAIDTMLAGTIPGEKYAVANHLQAEGLLESSSQAVFIAGEQITLRPGFHAEYGSHLQASILACTPQGTTAPVSTDFVTSSPQSELETEGADKARVTLRITPNPALTWSTLSYTLPDAGEVTIEIRTVSGQLVERLLSGQDMPAGAYTKDLAVQQFAAGVYFVQLTYEGQIYTERLVVIRP